MKSKPTLSQLIEERRMLFDNHRCAVTADMENKKKLLAVTLEKLSWNTCRSYSLLDLNKKQITNHFSAYHQLLKNTIVSTTDPDNWEHLLRQYPEEDHYHICETECLFYKLLLSEQDNPKDEINLMNVRRILNRDGSYDLYLIRAFTIARDDMRTPWLIMIETEYLFKWKTEVFYPYSSIVLQDKLKYTITKRFRTNNETLLTGKQMDMLKMDLQEKTLKDLADANDCNVNTLKTHKYSFIKRLNAGNLEQALFMAKLLRITENELEEEVA